MKNNKKKKKKFTKIERFLYKSCLIIIFFLIVGIVVTSASVSKLNIELQDMSKLVESQEGTNLALAAKFNEMTSRDKMQNISNNLGLSYNNDNIITIE